MSENNGAIVNNRNGSEKLFCDSEIEYKKEAGERLVRYLSENRRRRINSELLKGYVEMAEINLRLSEDGISSDNQALRLCEQKLAESECCDS